jgi:hypothetical protein
MASMEVLHDDQPLGKPQISAMQGYHQLRFAGRGDWGAPFEAPKKLAFTVQLTYPDQTVVKLTLRPDQTAQVATTPRSLFTRTTGGVTTTTTMRIADVQIGEQRIALGNLPHAAPTSPTRIETAKPAFPAVPPASTEIEEVLPPIDATGGRVRTSQVE